MDTSNVFVLLVTAILWCSVSPECEVLVHGPQWTNPVFVPQSASTVQINCTMMENADPFWGVNLASDSVDRELLFLNREELLNEHGVYELPRIVMTGMPPILRLLINDTERNNQTLISCTGVHESVETTIFVYEPFMFVPEFSDVNRLQSINISWSSVNSSLIAESNLTYLLAITSTNTQQRIFLTQTPHYEFNAPKGAPPCEVYNFSVTATYVGATYTGAGCSVPSPVLSRMLPSLPEISGLISNISLEKQSGEVTLSVHFLAASYCEDYPVTHYTLDIQSDVVPSRRQFMSEQSFIVAGNLSENVIYVCRLGATNSVGTVWSKFSWEIYTTDVQSVQVVERSSTDLVRVQCNFLINSDSGGCVVVLEGENITAATITLTREDDRQSVMITYLLPHPLSCYSWVFAFDIESDGSIGILPVPGMLQVMKNVTAQHCLTPRPPNDENSQPGIPLWILGVLVGVLLLVAVSAVLMIVYLVRRYRCCYGQMDTWQVAESH